jgi:hypothetical protein
MILSKRERFIVIATFGVLILLGIDRYLLSPLLHRRDDANVRAGATRIELAEADNVVNVQGLRANNRWKEMARAGLNNKPSETEGAVLNQLRAFAAESGLKLVALTPGNRNEKLKYYQQITIRGTASGRMDSIRKFLYRVEHAKLPMRVSDITVTSLKDGQDDLSVSIGITTIHLPVEQPKPAEAGGNAPASVSMLLEGRP